MVKTADKKYKSFMSFNICEPCTGVYVTFQGFPITALLFSLVVAVGQSNLPSSPFAAPPLEIVGLPYRLRLTPDGPDGPSGVAGDGPYKFYACANRPFRTLTFD
ncbi:hypothetical protein EVAR_12360_1 [Eumeta japonica]|uniref:Uncharacterized protein n=1 Tax=Eumeta variegata TaxID=151549 RepID=A0A4C1WZ86_EUMVA|nr:hypothetical protein EVAR_12360_1 [Eumeta japonica]